MKKPNLDSNKLTNELKRTPRLQWLLLLVVWILILSAGKALIDQIGNQKEDLNTQQRLLARLTESANSPFNEELLSNSQQHLAQLNKEIPTAVSGSVAEAKALADAEDLIGKKLIRKRLNLIGAETIEAEKQHYWSVRIDISGQLSDQDFVDVLSLFDASVGHRRIASFQYSPKASNTLNMVIDLLYRYQEHE
ncbi:hypothetical protein [Bowmanella yangjiangensis]|uniref:MSHA biogenesis protein MshJ n=1 Tax=Bowmanella yangjiangensis TaxID=2811230 RepID=A0ABS3CTI4_9ALTE|nr:hypothetical protein [Bowmanella yangjiangensis]MBN7820433.1 hypothetical protein [Bowmanella yangjiangensis]